MAQAVITRTGDETVIRIKGPVSEKAMNLIRSAVELLEEYSQGQPVHPKRLPQVFDVPLKPGTENIPDEIVDDIAEELSNEIKASAWGKLKHRYLPDEPAGS